MWNARIALPASVRAGEVVEVRTLISHPMESGFRRDAQGQSIPRNILTDFLCRFNNEEVLHVELFPAVAANPYLSFFVQIDESGTMEFIWQDQQGNETREVRTIQVD